MWIYLRHFLNMSTWAGLRAKLLLKDGADPMLFGCVKESEAPAVSNIYQCPPCVYFVSVIEQKGLWVQPSAEVRKEEGEEEEVTTQTVLKEENRRK